MDEKLIRRVKVETQMECCIVGWMDSYPGINEPQDPPIAIGKGNYVLIDITKPKIAIVQTSAGTEFLLPVPYPQ